MNIRHLKKKLRKAETKERKAFKGWTRAQVKAQKIAIEIIRAHWREDTNDKPQA